MFIVLLQQMLPELARAKKVHTSMAFYQWMWECSPSSSVVLNSIPHYEQW